MLCLQKDFEKGGDSASILFLEKNGKAYERSFPENWRRGNN